MYANKVYIMTNLITSFYDCQKKFWNLDFKDKVPVLWKTALSGMASTVALDLLTNEQNKSWINDLQKMTFSSITRNESTIEKTILINFAVHCYNNCIKDRVSTFYITPAVMLATYLYTSTVAGNTKQ